MRRSYAAYAAGAVAAAVSAVLAAPGGTVGGSAALRHGSQVAWLKESSVALHPAPGSPQVSATIASRTEFGSRTSLPVVAAGRGWLKVISANLRNGVYGYVRRWHVQVTWDPVAIDVDLSGRLLRVWRRGTVVLRATDKLTGFNPAAYGCCLLALSAHQNHLPPGWPGGDRIAIHGGGGIGAATSNGCLHATESVLRRLMRLVPLGSQVVIHP